jgi:undecaprenyl-diphosphatase
MAVFAIVGAMLLWRRKGRAILIGWIIAFAGGGLLDWTIKLAVHRNRPPYGATYLRGHSYSFPSGHAMGSLIGYGMLVYVLLHDVRLSRSWEVGATLAAACVIVVIGLSRVYLGVHYPSDVLGGWAAGAAWLAICLTGIGVARHRESAGNATRARSRAPNASPNASM